MRFFAFTAFAALLVLLAGLAIVPDTQAHQVTPSNYALSSRHGALTRRQFEDVNNKDPNANQSHYYDELSKPPQGLYIWTNLARLTRVSLRNGKEHLPFPINDAGELDMALVKDKEFLMYFIPLIVFIGSLLITCIANCCAGCCLCTCRRKRLARRQKDPFTKRQRLFAATSLAFVFFCWCVAIVGGIRGSMLFGRALNIMHETANKTFNDGRLLVTSFQADIGSAIDDIAKSVNDTADSFPTYIPEAGITNIQNKILGLADQCEDMNGNINSIIDASVALENSKDELAKKTGNVLAALIDDIDQKTLEMQDLYVYKTYSAGMDYRWNQDTSAYRLQTTNPPLSNIEDLRSHIADTQNATKAVVDALDAVQMPPIQDIIDEARRLGASLLDTIKNQTKQPIADVKNKAAEGIAPVKADMAVHFDPIDTYMDEYQGMADEYLDMVKKYELYRNIAFIVIFALPVLIIAFVAGGVGGRRPGLVKCCLCGSIPYTLLAIFLTILVLIFSVLIGEVCTVAFEPGADGKPAAASLLVTMSPDMGDMYVKAMAARDQCFTGDSAVQVVQKFIDIPDFSGMVNSTIDDLSGNLNEVTSSFDSTEVVKDIPDPSDADSAAQNAETTINDYNSEMSDFEPLDDQLALVRDVLDNLVNFLQGSTGTTDPKPITGVDLDTTGTWTSQELEDAAAILDVQVSELREHFRTLRDSGLFFRAVTLTSDIVEQYNNMVNNVTALVNTAHAITQPAGTFVTMKESITSYIDDTAIPAINASVPTIMESMKVSVKVALDDNIYYGETNCSEIARDTMDIQMGICDGFLTSFDSMWFAWFILGSVGALSVPVFVSAANMLADKDAKKPKKAADKKTSKKDDKKNDDKGGKKDKDKKGDKKGKDDVETGQVKWTSPKVAPAPTDPSQVHPTIAKTGSLLPGETGSPVRGQPPQIPPQRQSSGLYPSLDLPHYQESFSDPRSPTMPAQDFDEMRPAWLGGDVEVMSPAFSPRAQHPHAAVHQSYVSTNSFFEPSAPAIHSDHGTHSPPHGSHPSTNQYGEVVREYKRLSVQSGVEPTYSQGGQRISQYNPQYRHQ